MKYYCRQNVARYEKMRRLGVTAWANETYGGQDYADFSSRDFLDDVVPRLQLTAAHPSALELGCGVGPGALYLADHGFRVHGVDPIEAAIVQARRIARDRGVDNTYEVLDVTRIPHEGPRFDVVVDSYCLQSIVLDADRDAVFAAVQARLAPHGYYLISTAMYHRPRHHPETKIVDQVTGRVFDGYDEDDLFEASTGLHYEPYTRRDDVEDTPASYDDAIVVDGRTYIPLRRYLDGPGLKAGVEAHGFDVLYQSGEFSEDLVAVHRGSGVALAG